MGRWRALGITATSTDVLMPYLSAIEAATGVDRGQAIYHFYFPEDEELPTPLGTDLSPS